MKVYELVLASLAVLVLARLLYGIWRAGKKGKKNDDRSANSNR